MKHYFIIAAIVIVVTSLAINVYFLWPRNADMSDIKSSEKRIEVIQTNIVYRTKLVKASRLKVENATNIEQELGAYIEENQNLYNLLESKDHHIREQQLQLDMYKIKIKKIKQQALTDKLVFLGIGLVAGGVGVWVTTKI